MAGLIPSFFLACFWDGSAKCKPSLMPATPKFLTSTQILLTMNHGDAALQLLVSARHMKAHHTGTTSTGKYPAALSFEQQDNTIKHPQLTTHPHLLTFVPHSFDHVPVCALLVCSACCIRQWGYSFGSVPFHQPPLSVTINAVPDSLITLLRSLDLTQSDSETLIGVLNEHVAAATGKSCPP